MMARPEPAPIDWTQEHTQAAIRDAVLDRSPDIVAFQELPGTVPYVETHDMMRANPMTHSGNLATLVGNHLLDDEPIVATVPGAAVLTTLPSFGITVANVHLAPGPGGAEERFLQLQQITAASPTEALLVLGDTNTRVEEAEGLADIGLVGARPPRPTWDSRRNRFRADGPVFSAYFTRYFHTEQLAVDDVSVHDRPSVEIDGSAFHLSDHFALSGAVHQRTAAADQKR